MGRSRSVLRIIWFSDHWNSSGLARMPRIFSKLLRQADAAHFPPVLLRVICGLARRTLGRGTFATAADVWAAPRESNLALDLSAELSTGSSACLLYTSPSPRDGLL